MPERKAIARALGIVGGTLNSVLGVLGGLVCALAISLMATYLYRVQAFPLAGLLAVYCLSGTAFPVLGIWKRAYFRLIAVPLFVIFASGDSNDEQVEKSMAVAMIVSFAALLLLIVGVFSKSFLATITGFLLFAAYVIVAPRFIRANLTQ